MAVSSELVLLSTPAVLCALLAILVARPIIHWITRVGWVDEPNHRKVHDGLVPLAGGLIVWSSSAAVLVALGLWHAPTWQLWLACSMIFLVSFFDDRYPIRARFRFFVQLSAAAILCTSDIVLQSLQEPLGFPLGLSIFAVPFTIIGVAALTNAINMMDGLDGLAGGVTAIALFWIACALVLLAGDMRTVGAPGSELVTDAARAAGVLIGGLVVFLGFNMRGPWRKKAAIFMGDGGSMTLGFSVAAFAVYASSVHGVRSVPPVAIAWVIALPAIDLLSCFVRRMAIEGRTPMAPDRRHLHHMLLSLGLPVGVAVPLLHALALLTGAVGIVGWRLDVPQYVLGWGFIGVFAAYLMVSLSYWVRQDALVAAQARSRAQARPIPPARRPPPVEAEPEFGRAATQDGRD